MKSKGNNRNNSQRAGIIEENDNRKKSNVRAGEFMISNSNASENTSLRVISCANFMHFLRGYSVSEEMVVNKEKEKKVMVDGFFCGNRFCPICSKNKAGKDAVRLGCITDWLMDSQAQKELNRNSFSFLFLTLTVPNCKGSELSSLLTKMNNAFKLMFKLKRFKSISHGYFKKVEVTYNSNKKSKSYNTYHPHFHVLIAVDNSYFNNARKYIKQAEWLKAWQQVMKDPTISQVNVKKAGNGDSMKNAIKELSKYMAKDSQYLTTEQVFSVFYKSLKGRRLMTFSGVFKEGVTRYENGELDEYKEPSVVQIEDNIKSNWDYDKNTEYDNHIVPIKQVTDEDVEIIKEKLAKRGYGISRGHDNYGDEQVYVSYIGKTTYGEELTDD